MGFATKTPSVPTQQDIPVVSERSESDTERNYSQSSPHKKGLLSTILKRRNSAPASTDGNATLG